MLGLLFSKISVISDGLIKAKMNEAKNIMDGIDKDDTPFIAAALSIENDGIWSDDKHFKKQTKVTVLNTEELLKSL